MQWTLKTAVGCMLPNAALVSWGQLGGLRKTHCRTLKAFEVAHYLSMPEEQRRHLVVVAWDRLVVGQWAPFAAMVVLDTKKYCCFSAEPQEQLGFVQVIVVGVAWA